MISKLGRHGAGPAERDANARRAQPPAAPRTSIAYELALAGLALVSVAIGVYDFLHPRARPGFTWLDWVDLAIVALFVADFAASARRRGSLRAYARENWWEVPSLVPITGAMVAALEGYPVVRALRLARLVRLLRILRAAGVAARLRSSWGLLSRVARRSRVAVLLSAGGAITFVGSVAGWLAERHANERMAAYPDALWWALNMFSNVAYVDWQPVTGWGRVVAGVLEFLGIAFIGVFAASVTNALLREDDDRTGGGGAARGERDG